MAGVPSTVDHDGWHLPRQQRSSMRRSLWRSGIGRVYPTVGGRDLTTVRNYRLGTDLRELHSRLFTQLFEWFLNSRTILFKISTPEDTTTMTVMSLVADLWRKSRRKFWDPTHLLLARVTGERLWPNGCRAHAGISRGPRRRSVVIDAVANCRWRWKRFCRSRF